MNSTVNMNSTHMTRYPWQTEHQAAWEREGGEGNIKSSRFWQTLHDYWKSRLNPMILEEQQLKIAPVSFPSLETFGTILVLPEYIATVKRIVGLYVNAPQTGALISGQPGIGMC